MDRFRGTGVAVVTPFLNNNIDYNALGLILNHCISGGIDYIVSLGTTGESPTLSNDEKRAVLDFTIEFANGRTPIVAGNFGGNNTQAVCNDIDNFNFDGIDAILSSSPAYNKPSQEGLYQHYSKIANHSPRPVIIYNVPGRTASNITAETTLRIAHGNSNIIGIKEASADLVQSSEIIKGKPENFLVLSGDDPTALKMMQGGGDGVISVIANAYPKAFSDMARFALNDESDRASKIHHALLDMHPLLYLEGNPSGIKGALHILGLCSADVRLPLTSLTENTMTALKIVMAGIHL
ncbi:MAG: 4-hydroxy-tetrahydrodipicolinate synthase [Bacteroidetes bacterium]|nr:MAG: 4-hydroxy-tetrahydrodipicolinate synthase [Bacteroidota bacterium]